MSVKIKSNSDKTPILSTTSDNFIEKKIQDSDTTKKVVKYLKENFIQPVNDATKKTAAMIKKLKQGDRVVIGFTPEIKAQTLATPTLALGAKGQFGYRIIVERTAGEQGDAYEVTYSKHLQAGAIIEPNVPKFDPAAELSLRTAGNIKLKHSSQEDAARAVNILKKLSLAQSIRDITSPARWYNDDTLSNPTHNPIVTAKNLDREKVSDAVREYLPSNADFEFLSKNTTEYTHRVGGQIRFKNAVKGFKISLETRADLNGWATRTVKLPQGGKPGVLSYSLEFDIDPATKLGRVVFGQQQGDRLEIGFVMQNIKNYGRLMSRTRMSWELPESAFNHSLSGVPVPEFGKKFDLKPDRLDGGIITEYPASRGAVTDQYKRTDLRRLTIEYDVDNPDQHINEFMARMRKADFEGAIRSAGDSGVVTVRNEVIRKQGFHIQPEAKVEVSDVIEAKASTILRVGYDFKKSQVEKKYTFGDFAERVWGQGVRIPNLNPLRKAVPPFPATTLNHRQSNANSHYAVNSRRGLNVRQSPDVKGARISSFKDGAHVKAVENKVVPDKDGHDWLKVSGVDQHKKQVTGWVAAKHLKALRVQEETAYREKQRASGQKKQETGSQFVVDTPKGLNIREAPSIQGKKISALKNGTQVNDMGVRPVFDRRGNKWMKVSGADQNNKKVTGWVVSKALKSDPMQIQDKRVRGGVKSEKTEDGTSSDGNPVKHDTMMQNTKPQFVVNTSRGGRLNIRKEPSIRGKKISVFDNCIHVKAVGKKPVFDRRGKEWVKVSGVDKDNVLTTGWVARRYLTSDIDKAKDRAGSYSPKLRLQGFKEHIVRPGETLVVLSKKYGVNVQEMAELNRKHLNSGEKNRKTAAVGDRVYIPRTREKMNTASGKKQTQIQDWETRSRAQEETLSGKEKKNQETGSEERSTESGEEYRETGSHNFEPEFSSSSGKFVQHHQANENKPWDMSQRPPLENILKDYQVSDVDNVVWPAGNTSANWMFYLAEKPRFIILKSEAELLDKLSLWQLSSMHIIRNKAYAVADRLYPGPEGARKRFKDHASFRSWQQNDGHNDAYRHAFWSALMTHKFGEEFAKHFGDAHEQKRYNHPKREAMDLYNNEVGRKIATENPYATNEEIIRKIREAMAKGKLLVLSPNGSLAWSDQVEPGKHGSL